MQDIVCKKCGISHYVKSGYIRGHQRYTCKNCGCNFKLGDNRGKIKPEAKALAMLLYGSGKASYGMIARMFKVTRPAVLYWIRSMGSKLPEPVVNTEIAEVSIDEMWHFINKKKRKVWIWRAVDRSNNRTIGWAIGNRDADTFRPLYEKLKNYVKHYYTDKYDVYKEIIPSEQLTQSKKYTIGIEQNNSNVRHYLGRMTRRTKVVTKSIEMLHISLLIACNLNEYNGYECFQNIFLSIFS
jgi:IS1 family transposase/transposase-like protein